MPRLPMFSAQVSDCDTQEITIESGSIKIRCLTTWLRPIGAEDPTLTCRVASSQLDGARLARARCAGGFPHPIRR
jgi:hypothetical protein